MTDSEIAQCFKDIPDNYNPYDPESEVLHTGKVFVFKLNVLKAKDSEKQPLATTSDGTLLEDIAGRLFLCLGDAQNDDDGRSLWIELQSTGDYEIPHASKHCSGTQDHNWMDKNKKSYYRNGTILCLGTENTRFKYHQKQKRGIAIDELKNIRGKISISSIKKLLP